jgi:hypothetical protein
MANEDAKKVQSHGAHVVACEPEKCRIEIKLSAEINI